MIPENLLWPDWSVQNKKIDATRLILNHFPDLDVLQKNSVSPFHVGLHARLFWSDWKDRMLSWLHHDLTIVHFALELLPPIQAGVSPLTFAFNTGDNVLASAVIEHPSAAKLEPENQKDKKGAEKPAKASKPAKTKITATITHEMWLGSKTGPVIRCREMVRALWQSPGF